MKLSLSKTLTLLLLLVVQLSLAQEQTISGTVSDASGQPVPGVNIIVKGTTTGTQTDFDGNYTIKSSEGDVLVFSYLGLKTQEIVVGTSNTIDVTMLEDTESLDEVIITAVGIKRKPDEITTAYENLKADEITSANNPDAVQSLAGKVSGLQINTTSAGVTPNTEIILRGVKSITGNNTALVVIDNVISTATILSNLDPEVIESINVLKGPNGAALYGSRGGNGVIVVTTKKGTNEQGQMRIGLTSSVTIEDIAFLPETQDRYGKGYWGEVDAFDQGSWGPEYDGSLQPVGLPYPTQSDFPVSPYEHIEDNILPFFTNGVTFQNTLTISSGDQDGYLTLSANKRRTEGVIPDDEYNKDFFSLNAGKTLGKISVSGIARYTNEKQNTASAYNGNGGGNNVYEQLLQAPGNVIVQDFSSGDNGDHWTAFGDSPYWIIKNSRRNLRQQIIDLSGEVNYQFNDNINSLVRGNVVNSSYDFIDYNNAYTAPYTITGDGRDFQSTLQLQSGNSRRIYVDFLTNFNYQLTEDISLKSLIGFNFTEGKSYLLDTQGDQLTIPGLYTASNISSGIVIQDVRSIERGNAIFANVDLGYKDFLFLNLTARNEWNSRLQSITSDISDISFFYPSVSAAFIPTKAFPEIKSKVLHKMKVSAGYVKVGNIGALNRHDLFDIGGQALGFPYSGLNSFVAPTSTSASNIQPEFVTTYEGNINLEFLNINGSPRITLDASASFYTNDNQILNTSVSNSTGVTQSIINVGETETDAYEIDLGITPIRTDNFRWSANVGYASQKTIVNKVTDQSAQVSIDNFGGPARFAVEGQEFPVILGSAYERDEEGRVVLNQDGSPRVASGTKILGKTTPDYILNFGTELTYKGFTFRATADYRTGHVYYSNVYNDLTLQGRSFITAENGRGNFIFPNSTIIGSGVTNTTVLTGPSYGGPTPYAEYQSFVQSPQFGGVDENFVLDATAFKLREVALSYDVPTRFLEKSFVQALSVGFSGRNLLTILPKENRGYDDPEVGGGIGVFAQNPPTRFYTMNINLTF
ncbi:MAG: SusC/RagA family TonB-linked outer membrane protein [Algicola sp.]|nr:SusC/RagA family TonB-linked outer membrane protein [Algicola sp.]